MTALERTLLPCPMCGGEAEMDAYQGYRSFVTGHLKTAISVYCTACSVNVTECREDVPDIRSKDVAAAWNRRTPDPTPGTRAEGLEEAAKWHKAEAAWLDGQGCKVQAAVHRNSADFLRHHLVPGALAPPASPEPTRDKCEMCLGAKGGVPGNENIIGGVIMCDYCHATLWNFRPPASPEPAREAELRAYGEAVREACIRAVASVRYGSPSIRNDQNPPGWHLPDPCSPRDAAMHDNACNDAHIAIRQVPLPPAPLPTPTPKED